MKRKTALPELLAPAGSFEALLAAVEGGADAVYFGGRAMNARAFAKNFDGEETARAIDYLHLHGRRAYVTLNTLLSTRELEGALEYAAELYRLGVDALIVADLGLMRLLKREIPRLELHASTQASVHSSAGADLLCDELGVSRVVLARELSLENIRSAVDHAKPEIEIFLHGALCVSHSGQCLFSSLVGGRSGNRGACAQPCRLPYGGNYPLSLRDLCLAEHIPALIDSGVSSLKIEGRMKSPTYVHGVSRIYRRLLDEGRGARQNELAELARLFSRGGFTDRYLSGRHDKPMTGIRSEQDKAESQRLSEGKRFSETAVALSGHCEILSGMPARLTLSLGERSVSVSGDIPSPARTSPLEADAVKDRLTRLGGTPFTMRPEDLSLTLDGGLNLPPSSLNALRRGAVSALLPSRRELEPCQAPSLSRPPFPETGLLSLSLHSAEQLEGLDGSLLHAFDEIYLPLAELARCKSRMPSGVSLPSVVTDRELDGVRRALLDAKERGISLAMIENGGQLSLVKACGMRAVGGFRLGVTNRAAASHWLSLGLSDLILSPELPAVLAGHIGGRVIVAGRIPLMLLERCFIRETAGCEHCRDAALTDRRGVRFPLLREGEHRNLLLNSAVTYLGDRPELLAEAGIRRAHILVTNESPSECARLIGAYLAHKPISGDVRRLPKSF